MNNKGKEVKGTERSLIRGAQSNSGTKKEREKDRERDRTIIGTAKSHKTQSTRICRMGDGRRNVNRREYEIE